MKIQFLILALLFGYSSYSQNSVTKYYNNDNLSKEVPISKAKFAEIMTKDSNRITTTVKNLQTNTIVRSQSYKNDEPYGKWVIQYASGPKTIDYDFEIIYSNIDCNNQINLTNYLVDNIEMNYTAPKLLNAQPIVTYLMKNMVYPERAVESGLTGKVYVGFTITKEGLIKNIVVTNKSNIVLDKEAVRLIKSLQFVSPPKVNNISEDICIEMPISFRLN